MLWNSLYNGNVTSASFKTNTLNVFHLHNVTFNLLLNLRFIFCKHVYNRRTKSSDPTHQDEEIEINLLGKDKLIHSQEGERKSKTENPETGEIDTTETCQPTCSAGEDDTLLQNGEVNDKHENKVIRTEDIDDTNDRTNNQIKKQTPNADEEKKKKRKWISWSIMKNPRFLSLTAAMFCFTLPAGGVFLPALAKSRGCTGK